MRNVFLLIVLAVVVFTGCTKCDGEDPRARIVNNGTESVSVHIETSGGNIININNIDANMSSEYNTFDPGAVEFIITIGNVGSSQDYVKAVVMQTCFDYDIQIDVDNNVTSIPKDRNE